MIFAIALSILGFFFIKPATCGGTRPCDGQSCAGNLECCEQNGTSKAALTVRTKEDFVNNPYAWYAQWTVLFVVCLLGSLMVCCYWYSFYRRSAMTVAEFMMPCWERRGPSEHDSAGSTYPPPQYSRCGSFHQPPPPYSEVTSKPDLYPLVITCGEGDGKASGNYLMVHYFRNYVIQEPGSISATSTAESLNSSFLCNATNEANSIEPPPYSCASNYEEGGGGVRSLSSLTQSPSPPAPAPAPAPRARPRTISDGDRRVSTYHHNIFVSPVTPLVSFEFPRLDGPPAPATPPADGAGAGGSPLDPETYLILQQYYRNEARRTRYEGVLGSIVGSGAVVPSRRVHQTCDVVQRARMSPPQPVSPTDSVNWPAEERRLRRKIRARNSSLYMPLTTAPPPRPRAAYARASSRSAPATPSGNLAPNFSQRQSRHNSQHSSRHSSRNSRLEEESNPLLSETDTRADHKF